MRPSCWSNRPRSPAGIVKGSVDAGGVGRGDGRDDRASIHNFEASLGAWQRRTVSWGAPRIHGELLKLGTTVSERTVSRYLPDPLTRRSQTWRTFLANHIGGLACASTVTRRSRRAMTTSTPLFYRFALFRLHAMGGALRLSGHWSIGLLRANRRLLAGVSHRISFAAAHASARARPAVRGRRTGAGGERLGFLTLRDSISP